MRVVLPWRRGLLLLLAFLFALVALLPLRLVLIGQETSLAARTVEGSIWLGQLEDVRLADIAFGDAEVQLAVLPLLVGEVRLAARTDQLQGWIAADRRHGIIDLSGRAGGSLAGLPIQSLEFHGATALFRAGRCTEAEGLVRMIPASAIGSLGITGAFEGRLSCQGGALVAPLVSPSGRERLDIRLQGDGRYSASLAVRPANPAAAGLLAAAGFVADPAGLMLTITGRL